MALTTRVTATALAENSLQELESYEKTMELQLPLSAEIPPAAQLMPECWLSTEDVQCSCTGGTLEVTITVRVRGALLCRTIQQGIGSIALGDPLAPADPEISLRIYYAHAGEAVFAIARRFHVAPAQMRAANGLEADLAVLPQAQHLLVPGT